MSRVAKLIADLWRLDRDIEQVQSQLNKMVAKRAMIATVDLPEAMTEVGSSTFTTEQGLRCDVSYKIYGSLPSRENPDARYAAIDYLKAHDGAELIRSNVLLTFGKGDIRSANRTMRFLDAQVAKGTIRGEEDPPTLKVDNDVHAQSLQAWGRQKVAANEPIDLAIVGLRGMTMATVKSVR